MRNDHLPLVVLVAFFAGAMMLVTGLVMGIIEQILK
jgi:hypothetical protein